MIKIRLPFPPASLSGHNTGNCFVKAKIIKEWRSMARQEAGNWQLTFEPKDIQVSVEFLPANRRGDRMNYWNRMKPIFDGIADGLGVNDKRFTPAGYIVREPDKAAGYVMVRMWQDEV